MNDEILDKIVFEYRSIVNEREVEEALRAERQKAEQEESVIAALANFGIEPRRVDGGHAYFDYYSEEIHLYILNWKYGQKGFYRVLDEKCPKCNENYITNERTLDSYCLGLMLIEPDKRFHDCPNWMDDTPAEKVETVLEEKVGLPVDEIARQLKRIADVLEEAHK